MRKAPYGSVYTAEAFRAIMGIAVFELDIAVLFLDDGVYALLKGQDPAKLEMKPLGEAFPMLADVQVQALYVHDESLAERGLRPEDLVMDVKVIDSAQVAQLLKGAKVLPF